jgi:hypothetical protein
VVTQTPPLQLALDPCGSVVVHTWPHVPQFLASVSSLTHTPLHSV